MFLQNVNEEDWCAVVLRGHFFVTSMCLDCNRLKSVRVCSYLFRLSVGLFLFNCLPIWTCVKVVSRFIYPVGTIHRSDSPWLYDYSRCDDPKTHHKINKRWNKYDRIKTHPIRKKRTLFFFIFAIFHLETPIKSSHILVFLFIRIVWLSCFVWKSVENSQNFKESTFFYPLLILFRFSWK